MRCWDFGKRVALVEKGPLGGAGVFNGALSSKTFWELSRDFRSAQRLDRGFRAERVEVDFDAVRAVVDQACQEKTRQISRQLEALAEPSPGQSGCIRQLRGVARFLDPHTIRVEGTGAGESWEISAEHFIVATGSRPRELPNIEI